MKTKFFTFVLSFIPGVGHLYLGLLTRGLHFMLLFFGGVFIVFLTEMEELIILMPIIWFYSLFDALQKYDLLKEGIVEDTPLIQVGQVRSYHRILAYGLIGVGGYLLLERLVQFISSYFEHSWSIMHEFRLVAVALVFILIGFRLLRSSLPGQESASKAPQPAQPEARRDEDE